MSSQISEADQELLLHKLDIFKIRGKDKQGHKILPRLLIVEVVKNYLEEHIFPRLGKRRFSVLYVHTGVQRSDNFPGISGLRWIYEAIPINIRDNLQAVYFLHPGLQARLFLATFGRFLFSGGWVDYLWEHVKRKEVEIPDFVHDHDEDLEYRPMMDYGLESDHPRVSLSPSVSSYSMRCILELIT
ncbi:hypothetical protein ES288_D12G065300v1 [Gossypium darwinii]|uniref:CRAL-TRIO domain-containing protein n=1 Tax=Gossypium darwinii TaxID=34276 RepID=A0A5D2A7Q0_GOSDA|nr:hypothetical protein ES288_D12G065300v1 [Gossypium darwinii]